MFSAAAHPGIWPPLRASAAALAVALAATPAGACGAASGAARVAEVNARAELRLEDGRWLRLAGLDMPRALSSGADKGFDAASAARARLAAAWVGPSVAVALLAPRPDRWGRWLADLALPDGRMASADLIGAGLARVRPEFETRGCEADRMAAEAGARAASLGLWNEPDSMLDATDLDALSARDGHFVFIQGVVTRVGGGRSRRYIDFGRRGGFTAVVAKKLETAFSRRGLDIGALTGVTIQVRGVLETRFGPRVEVDDPLMLDRLDRAATPRETKSGG